MIACVVIFLSNLLSFVLTVGLGTCYQEGNCRLPSCFCGGKNAPGNMRSAEIPQMILFSFDDAVTEELNSIYEKLFSTGRLNPNGCPIAKTLFVSHNSTDYSLVRNLYQNGHEIAVHSVTHRTPTTFWKEATWDQIRFEIVQQRKIISENTGIPLNNITGWRSPFLQPSGERQYTLLKEHHFQYDSTLTVATENGFSAKLWPNTLDFGWKLECNVNPCPYGRYSGLWEIPVQMLEVPHSGDGCLYADSCRPETMEESFQLFWVNFHKHYMGSRSPLFYSMHASWLKQEHNFKALNYFMLTILHYYSDVYFITYQQLLAWMQDPTKLDNILEFEPWHCSRRHMVHVDDHLNSDAKNSGNSLGRRVKSIFIPFLNILCLIFIYHGATV